MKTELTTVPMFVFQQGDPFSGVDTNVEYPIEIKYYQNCISLEQNGNEVIVSYDYLADLCKEIKRHVPEAIKKLNP